jgi:hypothetical protein
VSTNPPSLSITTEKVCFIIVKARQFDVKDVVTDPDDASNATDDSMVSVLEDHREDPVADEIRGFIGALNEDEQIDLVALAWLGRGDGTIDDWDELRGLTISVRPPICLECRFSPITSTRPCRSSTGPAMILKWPIYDALWT